MLLLQLNHPYPASPQTSNGRVNHLGGGGRNGFDILVNVIHQQNTGEQSSCGSFQD